MASSAALSKAEVEAYLASVDLRSCLEGALNAAVAARAADPPSFFRDYFNSMTASNQGSAKRCAPSHACMPSFEHATASHACTPFFERAIIR